MEDKAPIPPTTPSTEIQESPFLEPWEDSDAVLIVEECRLHVHSSLLSLASPVFKAMFQSNFTESKTREINLPGKKKDEFIKLLKILYPQFTDIIEQEEATIQIVLLALAKEYLIDSLEKRIIDNCHMVLNDIKKDTCLRNVNAILSTLVIAENQKIQPLIDECITYMVDYDYMRRIIKCKIYNVLSVKTKWKIAKLTLEQPNMHLFHIKEITNHIDSVMDTQL